MVARWLEKSSELLYQSRIFSIRRAQFARQTSDASEGEHTQQCFLVDSPDWVNIIATTKNDAVLFVRQFRFGARRITLEIPGGMIDPGESPETAAMRELREETGFEASSWTSLGSVDTNPALLGNRCYTFLAQGCVRTQPPTRDPLEEISVEEHKLQDVPTLLADGSISHSLVAVAFCRLDLHNRGLL